MAGQRDNGRRDSELPRESSRRDTTFDRVISFHTLPSVQAHVGYGYAGVNLINAFKALGHKVYFQYADAPAALNFCQPNFYRRSAHQYNIGYTPWESTVIPAEWPSYMAQMDEIWTTSPQCREWFLNNGVAGDIRVVPHGIDAIWRPIKRESDGLFQFLHVGEPAERKGGQIVFDAFRAAFPKERDVNLVFKAYDYSSVRNYKGGPRNPIAVDNRVSVITGVMPVSELVDLHHASNAMIYPSRGEGFGLIPFQAAATGMPTAVTEWWCSYEDYVTHTIDSTLVDTNHKIHLGKWAEPDFDQTVEIMRDMYENQEALAEEAYQKALRLHRDYQWVDIARSSLAGVPFKTWPIVYNDGVEAIEYNGLKIDSWGLRIGTDISEQEAQFLVDKFSTIFIR